DGSWMIWAKFYLEDSTSATVTYTGEILKGIETGVWIDVQKSIHNSASGTAGMFPLSMQALWPGAVAGDVASVEIRRSTTSGTQIARFAKITAIRVGA
ncbi:unnamed protein product, partial [marine sediment metagenome]